MPLPKQPSTVQSCPKKEGRPRDRSGPPLVVSLTPTRILRILRRLSSRHPCCRPTAVVSSTAGTVERPWRRTKGPPRRLTPPASTDRMAGLLPSLSPHDSGQPALGTPRRSSRVEKCWGAKGGCDLPIPPSRSDRGPRDQNSQSPQGVVRRTNLETPRSV